MATSEKFCLRWNDFETNISVAFRELREEKDFFDVTLACDDSQVQAHKVILSACSPFFRNVLRRNPHQHPLLYLKGVKYKELLSVLNFMYMGEVNVAQEELNSFLSVAEDLRVKGLTQNNATEAPSGKAQPKQEAAKHLARPREPQEREPAPQPKRPRPPPPPVPQALLSDPIHTFQDDDIQEVVPVKSEPRDPGPMTMSAPLEQQPVYQHNQEQSMVEDHQQGTVALDESYADETYDYGQYEEGYDDGSGMAMGAMGTDASKVQFENLEKYQVEALEQEILEQLTHHSDNSWSCIHCEYTSTSRAPIMAHIEAKHMDSSGIRCAACDKICKTRNALNIHKTRYHKSK